MSDTPRMKSGTTPKERRCRIERPKAAKDGSSDGRSLVWLQVIAEMRLLDSPDAATAAEALGTLNDIRGWFDWETFVPAEMALGQRARFVQLLKLMAGTSSVGEAGNAYRSALRMLRQIDVAWQWEAA